MRPAEMRRLRWVLPLVLYGIFLWRTPYATESFPLRVLDWLVPAAGLAAWAILKWRRREPWPRTALDWPLLAWCAVTAGTAILSTNLRGSLRGAWEAWVWALILWLLVDAIRRGWGPVLWRATYLAGGVVCLLGVIEFLSWYLGWPLLPAFQQGWISIGGLSDPIPPILYRLSLTLVHATVLSGFTALLIPPAICILLATRDRSVRWGMLLWLIAAGGIQLLSLSRGGFLALGVSLPFLLVGSTQSPAFRRWWSGSSRRMTRVVLAGVIAGTLALAVAGGALLVGRLASHQSGDAVRWDLWRSAADMLRDHPWAGVGPTAFGTALRVYRNPMLAREHINTAHNLYLNTGAEMGAPGLIVGAWLLLTLAGTWWRRWRKERRGTAAWWRLCGVGGALAGLAAQMTVETFVEPAILLVAALLAAQILAPDPYREATPVQSRRWPWMAALLVLSVGAAGLAWDDWGYARFVRSITWTRQGNVDEAISAVERARSHDSGMSLYACHAGYLYGLQAVEGDRDALVTALERYQECMTEGPAPGWLDQLNHAALRWEAGQRDQARAIVKSATEQTPLQWMPWLNRGLWAEMEGALREAATSYGWVLALDPELAGSPFWQEGGRIAIWDEIVAAGQQVQVDLGGNPAQWHWQVAAAAGQWEPVASETESWLEIHPQDDEAMAWLGEALLNLGHPAQALDWLDRALESAPSRTRTYLACGETALALSRYDEAERYLRTALFLEPSYQVHLELARLAQIQGTEEEALREYSQALRPLVLSQSSDQVVYRRMSWPGLLPQVARIGYRQDQEAALEWGALLEQQGDRETAQRVYTAALLLDQFLDSVQSKAMDRE